MNDATMSSELAALAEQRDAIGRALAALCEGSLGRVTPGVADAIRYSLLGGGKRMRGTLLLCSYEAAGGRGEVTFIFGLNRRSERVAKWMARRAS